MAKYLVIGGAGFIGSHLCDYLFMAGNEVFCYDNCATGKLNNIIHLSGTKRFHRVMGTECNNSSLQALINRCDFIFHLAASVGVKYVDENPKHTMLNNLITARHVFEYNSSESNRKPLFFASSSEVYGNSDHIPFNEGDDCYIGSPEKLRWGYSCSKLM